jgi:hypothetical protein
MNHRYCLISGVDIFFFLKFFLQSFVSKRNKATRETHICITEEAFMKQFVGTRAPEGHIYTYLFVYANDLVIIS